MLTNKLWIEKYRPTTLEEFISTTTGKVNNFFSSELNYKTSLISSNHVGVGKSCLAKLICDTYFKDRKKIFFTSSDYHIIKKKSTDLFDGLIEKLVHISKLQVDKVVVLDNIDQLPRDEQRVLLDIISNTTHPSTTYILITDNLNSIDTGFVHQCVHFELNKVNKDELIKFVRNILTSERIDMSEVDLQSFVDHRFPNIKSILLDLQMMFITMDVDTYLHKGMTQDLFLRICDQLIEHKNWEEAYNLIESNIDLIDFKNLNKFIWEKALQTKNIRLIQITSVNEEKFSKGADERVIFISSLFEMVR